MLEHYNLILKNALGKSGNFSLNHCKILSKCALFLMEATEKLDSEITPSWKGSAHSAPSADNDILTMWKVITEGDAMNMTRGRKTVSEVNDPRTKGFEKIEQGWLIDYLQKGSAVENFPEEPELSM
eukprot:m.34580 g.34580  ORF g.34580 m.34580 type:complete len:126 (+) comp31999_c0_seq3:1906-2283(+)